MTGFGSARLRTGVLVIALMGMAGCEEAAKLPFLQPKDKAETVTASTSTRIVERDVEAPEVFQVTEAGLWDGRPSLGGVWVAHPDVTEPERVIIRNQANGKFVIGALFRREREIPGPRLQASSEAAAALGMLPGAPVELNVTALRKEKVEKPQAPTPEETEAKPAAPAEVTVAALDPVAGAEAAIEAAAPTAPAAKAKPSDAATKPKARPAAETTSAAGAKMATAPKPAPKRPASPLKKPYIQIGIFSVEQNAKRTADQMRSAGMIPTIHAETMNGKPFWRVVVGPARSTSERSALLKQVKSTGFSDAYYVTK
nr:SPOR domain-containing protein [Jhaorihella thermophila]